VGLAFRPTKRAFVLAFVIVFIMLYLAVPLRAFIRGQRDLGVLQSQLTSQQQAIADLTEKQTRLRDSAYLQALVRARLNYVFPGEIGFVVLDKETSTAISSVPGALVPNNDAPWYSKLWMSTKLADQPNVKNDPLVVTTPAQ